MSSMVFTNNHNLRLTVGVLASFFGVVALAEPLTDNNIKSAVQAWCSSPTTRAETEATYGPIRDWDTSRITTMNRLFYGFTNCNPDIRSWDVSSVTDMQYAFSLDHSFNQNIERWNVSSVQNMRSMFFGAIGFNQNLEGWDVSSVTNMREMFKYARVFDGNINGWDVSSVTDMQDMFRSADAFDKDLAAWDVSSVRNMNFMFAEAESFSKNVGPWDISSATNMLYTFAQTPRFDEEALCCSSLSHVSWSSSVYCRGEGYPRNCPRTPTTLPPFPPPPVRLTPPPTNPPTKTPTSEPTAQPTPSPTPNPTPRPSPAPTISPTMHPTITPTKSPTATPTSEPTTAKPTPSPTPDPTPRPSPAPTISPTIHPTITPTTSPTRAPTLKPTPSPRPQITIPLTDTDLVISLGDRTTGQVCSENSQCISKTCRNGACMASSACYPVKHKKGTAFDSHKVNIVFVGSGFDTTSPDDWQSRVNSTYRSFRKFNMFGNDVDELNIFLVDPYKLDPSFCDLNCNGIDRLLCCDIGRAHSLATKCFPVGSNLQTVVVHNDDKYGGAGYADANVATVSVHPSASLVAAHELVHSLFDLTDEYSYGYGTSSGFANCDASNTCDKWSDLIGNTPAGYKPVKCLPACRNYKYFVGAKSFMDRLDSPMGAVNERFTCCTYQALAKSMPSYCGVFDFAPGYLLDYCQKNDYQKYGRANYVSEEQLAIPGYAPEEDANAKYLYVSDPVLVTITQKIRQDGNIVFKSKRTLLSPGMFPKSQIEGDFRNAKSAAKKGFYSLLKVVVFYRGGKQTLFLSQNRTIEVPLPQPGETTLHQNVPRAVSKKTNVFEIVCDTKGKKIRRIRSKQMAIG